MTRIREEEEGEHRDNFWLSPLAETQLESQKTGLLFTYHNSKGTR